ncbi:MAG: hypothetical protein ABJO36_12650 [Litorimonas sp.]
METITPSIRKAGGIAALGQALCYIVGFAIFIFFLDLPESNDPTLIIEFLIENTALILSAMIFIYIVCGLIQVVLVLALHEMIKTDSKFLMQVATAIGIIWSGVVIASGMIFVIGAESVIEIFEKDPDLATSIWLTIGIVSDGLGGGTEIIGGVWILCVSYAAQRGKHFQKTLNCFGGFLGIIGILSVVPALGDLVDIFGLGQIVWFIWVGISMLRQK